MTDWVLHLAIVCACIWFAAVPAGCSQSPHRLNVRLLESQIHSGVTESHLRFLVISEQHRFLEVYNKIHAVTLQKPALPEVDFATQRVLVALMGQKSTAGYEIQFGEIALQRQSVIEVTVRLSTPSQDAVLAQVMTSPYALAVIESGTYTQVKFVTEAGEVLEVLDVH
jgi:PrcB C-terminal